MARRKKNVDISMNEELTFEAPKVETNIIIDKQEEIPVENVQNEVVINDFVMGNVVNMKEISDVKNKLFEPSKSKTLIINKIIKKKPDLKRIGQIKANLTQKPLASTYRGSRTRASKGFTLSFKLGKH